MSINVTVHGSPVSICRSRFLLSDVELLKKTELERRRKLRLIQVRQQSKIIANQVRQRVKEEKERQKYLYEKQQTSEQRKRQRQELASLQKRYQECLEEVGRGHMDAALEPDPEEVLAAERERWQAAAVARGQMAAEQLRTEEEQARKEHEEMEKRRAFTRTVEDLRSSIISSLPKKKLGRSPTRGHGLRRRKPVARSRTRVMNLTTLHEVSHEASQGLRGGPSKVTVDTDEETRVPAFIPPLCGITSDRTSSTDRSKSDHIEPDMTHFISGAARLSTTTGTSVSLKSRHSLEDESRMLKRSWIQAKANELKAVMRHPRHATIAEREEQDEREVERRSVRYERETEQRSVSPERVTERKSARSVGEAEQRLVNSKRDAEQRLVKPEKEAERRSVRPEREAELISIRPERHAFVAQPSTIVEEQVEEEMVHLEGEPHVEEGKEEENGDRQAHIEEVHISDTEPSQRPRIIVQSHGIARLPQTCSYNGSETQHDPLPHRPSNESDSVEVCIPSLRSLKELLARSRRHILSDDTETSETFAPTMPSSSITSLLYKSVHTEPLTPPNSVSSTFNLDKLDPVAPSVPSVRDRDPVSCVPTSKPEPVVSFNPTVCYSKDTCLKKSVPSKLPSPTVSSTRAAHHKAMTRGQSEETSVHNSRVANLDRPFPSILSSRNQDPDDCTSKSQSKSSFAPSILSSRGRDLDDPTSKSQSKSSFAPSILSSRGRDLDDPTSKSQPMASCVPTIHSSRGQDLQDLDDPTCKSQPMASCVPTIRSFRGRDLDDPTSKSQPMASCVPTIRSSRATHTEVMTCGPNAEPSVPSICLPEDQSSCRRRPCITSSRKRHHQVQFYDYSNRYERSYRPTDLVERIEKQEEPDACQCAEQESAADEAASVQATGVDRMHSRGQRALARERVHRDYKQLLGTLSGLAKEERQVRAGWVASLPTDVYFSDERRKERTCRRQKNMDSAFESIYHTSTLASETQDAVTKSQSGGVSRVAVVETTAVSKLRTAKTVDPLTPVKLNVGQWVPPPPQSSQLPASEPTSPDSSITVSQVPVGMGRSVHFERPPSPRQHVLEQLLERIHVQRSLLQEEVGGQGAADKELPASNRTVKQSTEKDISFESTSSHGSTVSCPELPLRLNRKPSMRPRSQTVHSKPSHKEHREKQRTSEAQSSHEVASDKEGSSKFSSTKAIKSRGTITETDLLAEDVLDKARRIRKEACKPLQYEDLQDLRHTGSLSLVAEDSPASPSGVVSEYSLDMSVSHMENFVSNDGSPHSSSTMTTYEGVKIIVSVRGKARRHRTRDVQTSPEEQSHTPPSRQHKHGGPCRKKCKKKVKEKTTETGTKGTRTVDVSTSPMESLKENEIVTGKQGLEKSDVPDKGQHVTDGKHHEKQKASSSSCKCKGVNIPIKIKDKTCGKNKSGKEKLPEEKESTTDKPSGSGFQDRTDSGVSKTVTSSEATTVLKGAASRMRSKATSTEDHNTTSHQNQRWGDKLTQDQTPQTFEESSSTAYMSPPDQLIAPGNMDLESLVQLLNQRRMPGPHTPAMGTATNPQLIQYIARLLAMSRESVSELNVSSSDVSSFSTDVVDQSLNMPPTPVEEVLTSLLFKNKQQEKVTSDKQKKFVRQENLKTVATNVTPRSLLDDRSQQSVSRREAIVSDSRTHPSTSSTHGASERPSLSVCKKSGRLQNIRDSDAHQGVTSSDYTSFPSGTLYTSDKISDGLVRTDRVGGRLQDVRDSDTWQGISSSADTQYVSGKISDRHKRGRLQDICDSDMRQGVSCSDYGSFPSGTQYTSDKTSERPTSFSREGGRLPSINESNAWHGVSSSGYPNVSSATQYTSTNIPSSSGANRDYVRFQTVPNTDTRQEVYRTFPSGSCFGAEITTTVAVPCDSTVRDQNVRDSGTNQQQQEDAGEPDIESPTFPPSKIAQMSLEEYKEYKFPDACTEFENLTERCTKRITDLAQMIENVRREKQRLVGTGAPKDEVAVLMPARELKSSSSSDGAPTHPRPKPPPALWRSSARAGIPIDEPHELSTIIEVDTPQNTLQETRRESGVSQVSPERATVPAADRIRDGMMQKLDKSSPTKAMDKDFISFEPVVESPGGRRPTGSRDEDTDDSPDIMAELLRRNILKSPFSWMKRMAEEAATGTDQRWEEPDIDESDFLREGLFHSTVDTQQNIQEEQVLASSQDAALKEQLFRSAVESSVKDTQTRISPAPRENLLRDALFRSTVNGSLKDSRPNVQQHQLPTFSQEGFSSVGLFRSTEDSSVKDTRPLVPQSAQSTTHTLLQSAVQEGLSEEHFCSTEDSSVKDARPIPVTQTTGDRSAQSTTLNQFQSAVRGDLNEGLFRSSDDSSVRGIRPKHQDQLQSVAQENLLRSTLEQGMIQSITRTQLQSAAQETLSIGLFRSSEDWSNIRQEQLPSSSQKTVVNKQHLPSSSISLTEGTGKRILQKPLKSPSRKDKPPNQSQQVSTESDVVRLRNEILHIQSSTDSSPEDLESTFQRLGIGWASAMLRKTQEAMAMSSSSSEYSPRPRVSNTAARHWMYSRPSDSMEDSHDSSLPRDVRGHSTPFVASDANPGTSKDNGNNASRGKRNVSFTGESEISTVQPVSPDNQSDLSIKTPNISLTSKFKTLTVSQSSKSSS